MTNMTRRVFTRTAVALPLAGTAIATLVRAGEHLGNNAGEDLGVNTNVQALWAERDALLDAADRISHARREAAARLPWWAAEGPRELHSDGSMTG